MICPLRTISGLMRFCDARRRDDDITLRHDLLQTGFPATRAPETFERILVHICAQNWFASETHEHLPDRVACHAQTDLTDGGLCRYPRRSRFAATINAAMLTTAIPCWSSCITGISSMDCNRSSISKQRGAEISSSWMAANVGAMAATARHNFVGVFCVQQDRHTRKANQRFHQHGFGFHDRHARQRTNIA